MSFLYRQKRKRASHFDAKIYWSPTAEWWTDLAALRHGGEQVNMTNSTSTSTANAWQELTSEGNYERTDITEEKGLEGFLIFSTFINSLVPEMVSEKTKIFFFFFCLMSVWVLPCSPDWLGTSYVDLKFRDLLASISPELGLNIFSTCKGKLLRKQLFAAWVNLCPFKVWAWAFNRWAI